MFTDATARRRWPRARGATSAQSALFARTHLMFEKNTKSNMPAQIEIYAEGQERTTAPTSSCSSPRAAAPPTSRSCWATPSILTHDRLIAFLKESAHARHRRVPAVSSLDRHRRHLGRNKVKGEAPFRYLDDLPTQGPDGHVPRPRDGAGVQAPSRSAWRPVRRQIFLPRRRVIRLPRHGASLPIGLGVSCSADRGAQQGHATASISRRLDAIRRSTCPTSIPPLGGEVVHIDSPADREVWRSSPSIRSRPGCRSPVP